MESTPEILEFGDDDLQLLEVEPLSEQMRVSRAFVRLCLDAGCPTRHGKASAAEVINWLFEHYAEVRSLAGLTAIIAVENLPDAVTRRLKMANALFTILEFSEMRSSDLEQKRSLRDLARSVEHALERA
jgi:hypothetical protein